MTKIVLTLTLSAAMLAGAPVSALGQDPKEKDRCELKQDATELIVACQKSVSYTHLTLPTIYSV